MERKTLKVETLRRAELREKSERLILSLVKRCYSKSVGARILALSRVYGMSEASLQLEVFRKAIDAKYLSDTSSIFEEDMDIWTKRFQNEIDVLSKKAAFIVFEKEHIQNVLSDLEARAPDFLDGRFVQRIGIDIIKDMVKLAENYNLTLTMSVDEKVDLVHLPYDEFQLWVKRVLAPLTTNTLQHAMENSLKRKGLLGEPNQKELTRKASEWCYAQKRSNPKERNRTIANKAVKQFFPHFEGKPRQKKIDALRKTLTRKFGRRRGTLRPIYSEPME